MNILNMYSWKISKQLLFSILEDKVSDRFVCELIWERLFYQKENENIHWSFSSKTPKYWSDLFPEAPLIISQRRASIHLTRSIDKESKQGLKEFLGFRGYKISELYPRLTRRATAVNWLIFWARNSNFPINEFGLSPRLLDPPQNPAFGHPGDLVIT